MFGCCCALSTCIVGFGDNKIASFNIFSARFSKAKNLVSDTSNVTLLEKPICICASASNTSVFGYLRVFTFGVKSDTDYKTLKITSRTKSRDVVEMILNKFRLNFRDVNLFQLWMEVRTRHNGEEVKSILELDKDSCPLELQRCHPREMSRFILSMVSNAILARIYDGDVCPQSNYKSVLISRRTTCLEALRLVLQMCRIQHNKTAEEQVHLLGSGVNSIVEYRLFVVENDSEAQIPNECMIAGVYLSLMPNQKIVLRRVVMPINDTLSAY